MMKRNLIYLLLIALLNLPVAAQQSQPSLQRDEQPPQVQRMNEFSGAISRKINFANSSGNILTRMEETRAVALEYPPEKNPEEYGLLTTYLKTYSAAVGNYADAIRYDDFVRQKYPDNPAARNALADYRAVSALKAISEATGKTQIVIVNEAHDVPQHRVFTLQLLKELKKKGYQYFAAEALFNEPEGLNKIDAELNRRGYPTKMTGTYMDEPVYGDIIRTALGLGYKIVPYDGGFRSGGLVGVDERERKGAENLVNSIFKDDPQAKVLIHVGYGHNSEAQTARGGKMLAGYLKEITNIDPLTVDQTVMSERSALEYEQPLYRFVAANKDFNQPTIFQNLKGEFWKPQNASRDAIVFSPRSVYMNGRPAWLELGGARKQYLLPADVCQTEKHCLVRARFANESADAVPIDQIEARANAKTALMLPKGNFIIEVENAAGKSLKSWQIRK